MTQIQVSVTTVTFTKAVFHLRICQQRQHCESDEMVFAALHSQVDPSGEVVLFSQGGCPWKEHLFAFEKELNVETPIKFVLYTDQNGQWRVQCVPTGLNNFQNRY